MRKSEIDDLLGVMLESYDNVSDLNITCDRPLQVEAAGELVPVPVDPAIENLTPFQTEIFALNLVNNDRRLTEHLLRQGSCDSSYSLPGKARFRVNIFSQRGNFSIVLRKLETIIPTIEELKLPEAFKKMPGEKNGLILVTGATGSGKTTSLAALLNEINSTKSVHVVTLEDPVEYVHPNRKSTFNQRELGLDYDNFANGLRAALRQAPKIILVGEMRDRETAELALKASETGHLVLSTLHTVNAGQAINRIVGMFDQDEEKQTRQRLADTIRWVVGQRLGPPAGRRVQPLGLRREEEVSAESQAGESQYEARLALVCEDASERQAVIRAALEQIGFAMLAPKNTEDAVERIRRDSYEIVIVDEQYQGSSPFDNPVLAIIRNMPMSQRRWMFVTLLGRQF